MPRNKAPVATAKSQSMSVATIDAQLASQVATLKDQISQGGGNKIRVEATGDFILPDGMNLGNEIKVVVLDFVSRNNFYMSPFDRNNPTPPDCYAMGRNINTMVPEADSPEKQNDACRSCPMNAFGSGANGKSKACKNSRMLAVLVYDDANPEAINAPDAPIYVLDLPPTAIVSFDGAVGYAARALGHYIKAVFTVSAVNAGTYAKISFVDPVPNQDYATHYTRVGECDSILFRKPDFEAYKAKAAATPARRGGVTPRRPGVRR